MLRLEDICNHPLVQRMRNLPYETSLALYIGTEQIYALGLNEVGSEDRVFLPSLDTIINGCKQFGTNKVVIIHNHPSGNIVPSDLDVDATISLREQLKAHGVIMVDHIIIGSKGAFSFMAFEQG